ncbi:cytochrome c-type biogenesis protein [Deinococcus arboris]|uniref:cytochrome c-type biogenesis protein n=1 Tax=Deinococcus arboris TaxID=2682977 RepID=UPI0034E26453
MRPIHLTLLTLGLLGGASAAPTLTPAQEARAAAIQKNLRCPLCDTGESIADSRADISATMRAAVRQQVAAGRGDGDIYLFFTQRYGNFVLLDPPKSGRNLWLWGTPLAALAAGGALLWVRFRRGPATSATLDAQQPDDAFDSYLAQVQRDTGQGRKTP